MTAIRTENLNISYGNLDIVKDLNINIPKGKITTIIGANGCGKSTILKTIARIITPKSGDIYINETNIKEQSSKDLAKTMAVLPQSPQAPKGLTVEELIAYGRFPHQKGFGKLKKDDEDIITWALEVTGIKEFRHRPIEALSGGQRQRVALGRAIVRNQKVFLMDEPLSNLDAKLRVSMRNEISKLHRELGSTTIYVTHDQVEAMTMADRIVVMKDGIIQQIGTPMDLYDNPRNKFVGSFIGSPQMNFLNVEVKGNKAILENGSKITLPEGILKRMNNRQGKLCMGFRAEDIKLDNLNIGLFEDSIITSAIENTEIMGNENNLYFKIGNTTAVARVGKEDVKEIGEQFKFVINVNKVHFFDLDTEENILNLGNTLTLENAEENILKLRNTLTLEH